MKGKTPLAYIRAVIRRHIWLKSRERAKVLKRDNYTCVKCHVKQTKKKGQERFVIVHHKYGINWKRILETIREEVLQDESRLITLCPKCHEEEHLVDDELDAIE